MIVEYWSLGEGGGGGLRMRKVDFGEPFNSR